MAARPFKARKRAHAAAADAREEQPLSVVLHMDRILPEKPAGLLSTKAMTGALEAALAHDAFDEVVPLLKRQVEIKRAVHQDVDYRSYASGVLHDVLLTSIMQVGCH